ncbi:hypothetical protein ABZ499_01240 [Streptomyces sp. NPDC019990]|uniref:hypothetical protein n=1 Tax=Streptomyces sp. NPDC019990 TaxID=3154693 RepID=UPI0033FBAD7E
MGYRTRAYGIPGSLADYHPDAHEAIERWFTMPNTGNSRAVADIIEDLVPMRPAAVVDPFCGAGSTALAARRLGIPFVGVETDPVLACVSTAKSLCGPDDGQALLELPEADESPALRCLRLVHRLQHLPGGGRLSAQMITEDLSRGAPHVPGSMVVRGDSTVRATWEKLTLPDGELVIFTSPPFFDDWTGPEVPPQVRVEAESLLAGGVTQDSYPAARGYGDLLVGALRAAQTVVPHCTAIVEHEPGSGPPDRLLEVADRLTHEAGLEIVEILETSRFSPGGLFSLLVCRL